MSKESLSASYWAPLILPFMGDNKQDIAGLKRVCKCFQNAVTRFCLKMYLVIDIKFWLGRGNCPLHVHRFFEHATYLHVSADEEFVKDCPITCDRLIQNHFMSCAKSAKHITLDLDFSHVSFETFALGQHEICTSLHFCQTVPGVTATYLFPPNLQILWLEKTFPSFLYRRLLFGDCLWYQLHMPYLTLDDCMSLHHMLNTNHEKVHAATIVYYEVQKEHEEQLKTLATGLFAKYKIVLQQSLNKWPF